MTGALWAIVAGVGFGVFQTLNRRAVRGMDVYTATFMQLFVSAIVLTIISLVTEDMALLGQASIWAWINFSLAGFLHFFVGWTFLNASQKLIGAARTGSLIGTTPLFGALFAAIILAEIPTLSSIAGILLIVFGVYLVNYARIYVTAPVSLVAGRGGNPTATPAAEGHATGLGSLRLGLAAAICWSLSPAFIRAGLAELSSPIIGVTIGIVASVLGYAIVLGVRGWRSSIGSITTDALAFKLIAAVLVGLATWARWIALDLAPVAVVLALSLVSVPVVNILSPLVVGRDLEQVTAQVWLGSGLIVGGSLILILL
jgi:drug/metabolite transporter (DMT)-like permease